MDENKVLYGVPVIERIGNWSLLANIEIILRYYHPDIDISQMDYAEYFRFTKCDLSMPDQKYLTLLLNHYIGIHHVFKYDCGVEDIKECLRRDIPPIVTIQGNSNTMSDDGLDSVIIVGFSKDELYYISHRPPNNDYDSESELIWGHRIMKTMDFQQRWNNDILEIRI